MSFRTEQTECALPDGVTMPIYLASPDGKGPFPALVLAYELWGMQEIPGAAPHMRDLAARFAGEGFVAAIPDNYAARKKQPRFENGAIVDSPSDAQSIADLCVAVQWLRGLESVNAGRVAVVGWCGGGRQALYLAAQCQGLRAAASFYGRPINRPNMHGPSPIDGVRQMRCPVFGAYGEKDAAIPADTVRTFEQALAAANIEHEIHIYPEAGHAFMNDGRPEYIADAAADSWRRLLSFLARNLQTPAAA